MGQKEYRRGRACAHYVHVVRPKVVSTPPSLSILFSPFFFVAMPSPVGRVVARPPPLFFLAYGGLGWRLLLPGGGYPLPTPFVCAHYAHAMHSGVMGIPPLLPLPALTMPTLCARR